MRWLVDDPRFRVDRPTPGWLALMERRGGMAIEDQLRDRLRKVEALFFGAATAGERNAAGAAAERLRAKLDEAARGDPPIEMKFTMPDFVVGASVHRALPALRPETVPLRAPALDDGHGQGAATAIGGGRLAGVRRASRGPVRLSRRDDRAADPRRGPQPTPETRKWRPSRLVWGEGQSWTERRPIRS